MSREDWLDLDSGKVIELSFEQKPCEACKETGYNVTELCEVCYGVGKVDVIKKR